MGGDVDPAARVISLGPVSDVVDSGVLQQLMRAVDTSQHVGLESCESKPGTGWGREAGTAASANTGTSRRFQIRRKGLL